MTAYIRKCHDILSSLHQIIIDTFFWTTLMKDGDKVNCDFVIISWSFVNRSCINRLCFKCSFPLSLFVFTQWNKVWCSIDLQIKRVANNTVQYYVLIIQNRFILRAVRGRAAPVRGITTLSMYISLAQAFAIFATARMKQLRKRGCCISHRCYIKTHANRFCLKNKTLLIEIIIYTCYNYVRL